MSQLSVRRTENWKFAHAAAAMGAFWAQARKIEERRRRRVSRPRLAGTRESVGAAATSPGAAAEVEILGAR